MVLDIDTLKKLIIIKDYTVNGNTYGFSKIDTNTIIFQKTHLKMKRINKHGEPLLFSDDSGFHSNIEYIDITFDENFNFVAGDRDLYKFLKHWVFN